jgi:polyhydroxyalkanoate synthesis regulator phasin
MKTKTLIELMTLGSSIYLLSQDKEKMEKLSNLVKDGKEKFDDFFTPEDGAEYDEMTMFQKLAEKAKEVEKQLEKRLEEAAVVIYQKLHIAHVNDIEALQNQINELKEELAALKSQAKN